jgi:aspartate/tyrosine/aromatic aminotransferase
MTKDSQEAKVFIDASNFSCRVKWSSTSISGMNIITKLVLNDEYRDQYNREIKAVVSMLEERSLIFIKEAKEVGLKTLPYERGFFICVPVDNPDDVRKKLHEDKVYLISTENCLRIALCSVTKSEAKRLPKIIKERLSKI